MPSTNYLPIFRPRLPAAQEILPFLLRIDKAQRYTNGGALVRELENEIGIHLGMPPSCVVLLANATIALEGAVKASKQINLEWVTPSWTFVATPHALSNAGVSFRFGDVANDWRLDLSKVSEPELGLLDVVPFGDKIDFSRYKNSSSNIVVDAAVSLGISQGIGASMPKNVGLVFSLHATKLISTGEGGVFCSLDEDWVQRVRAWSNFGFNGVRSADEIGTNGKLSEYSAAVGLASLASWPTTLSKIVQLSEWARDLSRKMSLNTQPSLTENQYAPYWIVWSESKKDIENIARRLTKYKIETRRWWEYGCHKMRAFSNIAKIGSLEVTERISNHSVGLPFFPDMTKEERKIIEKALLGQ